MVYGQSQKQSETRFMAKTASSKQVQEFFYRAPGATSVQLVGDFTHWQKSPVQMQKQSDGTWKATLALTPGTHHYRFVVDGEWCDDPDCTVRVPNAFGSHNMVREVPVGGLLRTKSSGTKSTGRWAGRN